MKVISLMYHDVVERGAHEQSGFGGADAALYKMEQSQFKKHLQAIAGAVRESPANVFDLQAVAHARRPCGREWGRRCLIALSRRGCPS